MVNALSYSYTSIVNCLITDIKIKNPETSELLESKAIWDTGAMNSVITESAAQALNLIPIGKADVHGVHGWKTVNVYNVNITLNNESISIDTRVTECDELSVDKGTGMLIGMNIITLGDLTITNFDGKTGLTFRVPSLQNVDYVQEIAEFNHAINVHNIWTKSNNNKCPCGSGKDFKNCHGKSIYFNK